MLAVVEVYVDDNTLFLVVGGTVVEFSLWTYNHAAAPERDAVGLSAGVRLMAYAVYRDYRQSIGYGMPALHGSPCFALPLLFVCRVAALVAYCRGVYEDFCSLQGHDACSLRVPLVPADENSETAYAGIDGLEAKVTGCEIELLVVCGVVRYVHLAVFPGYAAVFLYHHSRVVV